MRAYVFPGQGSQYPGMGRDLLQFGPKVAEGMARADEVLGFDLSRLMTEGTEDDLRQTRVTQPAVFLFSVLWAESLGAAFKPDMVAGHSLGEFSALTAVGALRFEDGLRLVALRANAMQEACLKEPSTMAAVLGLDDDKVKSICETVSIPNVVAANYNCPGQVVISGSPPAVEAAGQLALAAGALKVVPLAVSGAFHSPYMAGAGAQLSQALSEITLAPPSCPIYQNVAPWEGRTDPDLIAQGLKDQLTGAVLWTQTVLAMREAGATEFTELGPGKVLQGLIRKIDRQALVVSPLS